MPTGNYGTVRFGPACASCRRDPGAARSVHVLSFPRGTGQPAGLDRSSASGAVGSSRRAIETKPSAVAGMIAA